MLTNCGDKKPLCSHLEIVSMRHNVSVTHWQLDLSNGHLGDARKPPRKCNLERKMFVFLVFIVGFNYGSVNTSEQRTVLV